MLIPVLGAFIGHQLGDALSARCEACKDTSNTPQKILLVM